jgi:hypothetical protein
MIALRSSAVSGTGGTRAAVVVGPSPLHQRRGLRKADFQALGKCSLEEGALEM